MTKQQAKRYAYRVLAAEAHHHIANGSEWLRVGDNGEEFSNEDHERVRHAVEEIAATLRHRGWEPNR